MALNKIQIKRSTSNAVVTGLANGELAFTQASNTLYIGAPDGSGVIPIAGKYNYGVLTANQALVANSSSFLDRIQAANAVIYSLMANGSYGTAGQVLVSNGSNLYWGTGTTGSNTQVQFNDSGVANASAGFTFNKATNTLFIANTISVGSGISVNTLNVAMDLTVSNSALVNNNLVVNNELTVNHSSYLNGNLVINSAAGIIANGSIGSTGQILWSNGTTVYWSTATFGTNTQVQFNDSNFTNASAGFTFNKSTNTIFSGNGVSATYVNATSATFTSNVIINDTLDVDNIYPKSAGSNAYLYLAGSGGTAQIANVYIPTQLQTNFITGFNALSDFRVSQPNANIVHVTDQTARFTTSSNAVYFSANSVEVLVGTDLYVTGNSSFGDSNADMLAINASIDTNIIPSANITYNLGADDKRWANIYAQNVHTVDLTVSNDLSVGGDLFVTGNLAYVNVSTLAVTDSLIQLASNNNYSDILDIGFYGSYNNGSIPGQHEHTGMFRDYADGVYKLFQGLTTAPNSNIDTTDPTFKYAFLQSYLVPYGASGNFVVNSTAIYISSNSSLSVNLTANTLALISPLAANSGGTGINSYALEDILVANGTSSFRKLGLGSTGYVLQSNGTALVYDSLDGGVF